MEILLATLIFIESIVLILCLALFLAFCAYPVLALIQVLNSIQCYFEEGRHPNFYKDVRIYACLVTIYFAIAALICTNPICEFIPDEFYNIYFYVVPIPIALYNISIMKKEHIEEIEKLIF